MDKLLFDALCAQTSPKGTYDAALEGKKLAAGCARGVDPDQGTETKIAPKWFEQTTYTHPLAAWLGAASTAVKLTAVALAAGGAAVLYFHMRPQRVLWTRA